MATLKPLTRDIEVPSIIETTYISKTANGQRIFDGLSFSAPGGSGLNTSSRRSGRGVNPESIFQGFIKTIFNSNGKEYAISNAYNIEILESMDMLYRTGTITIEDKYGFVDLTGVTNTLEGETLDITLLNKFEGDKGRTIKFGMYGMVDTPWENKTTYKLFEDPIFTNLNKNVTMRSYSNVRADQLIANVMAVDGQVQNIRFIEETGDPKFPTFIFPNVTLDQCIRYLSSCSYNGPIKAFNISKGRDTVMVIASLQKFIDGSVYSSPIQKIVPSTSELMRDAIKLGEYTIFGVSETDRINEVVGESVICFDYFSGSDKKDLKTFDKNKYEFDSLTDKNYATNIGGEFKNAHSFMSSKLGEKLCHKKELSSTASHIISIDSDERPLVQAKLKSRFRQAFHDEFMLRIVLPGYSEINIGQIFDIIIPSEVQPKNINLAQNSNPNFSGKWLLWKIKHKTTVVDNRIHYKMVCDFYRTGFVVPRESRNLDNAK